MKSLTVTLDAVTPLFLGGASPRGIPELRAPSFRGVLRYWLRALFGGTIGDAPEKFDELRNAEASVFGSTDKGASPVVVRISHKPHLTASYSELTERDSVSKSYGKQGIAYLFFAARESGQDPERHAIWDNNPIELDLSIRAGLDAVADRSLLHAYAALWLLTHLGGVGARSRRGAGSLQVKEASRTMDGMPSLQITANTPKELKNDLQNGLTQLRQQVDKDTNPKIGSTSSFNILHPNVCKVWVVDKSFPSWMDALDTIGKAMQQFRVRRLPDYNNVRLAVQGGVLGQPVQRSAFGLPIIFSYSSLYKQYKKEGYDNRDARRKAKGILEGEKHERRSSPLLVHATRLANNQHALVLTKFDARLLENGEKLKLKRNGPPSKISAPGLSLIDQFLSQLDRQVAARLKVEYK